MPSDYASLNQVIKGETGKRLKGELPEGAHGKNAQVADAQANPAQVGGAAPVYPAQVGGAAQVDPVGGAAQVNLAQVGGAQVGYVQAKAKKAPKKPAPASFLLVFYGYLNYIIYPYQHSYIAAGTPSYYYYYTYIYIYIYIYINI